MSGLLISAPSSGSGKTTVTLGLMRAFADHGVALAPGKAGPDYIDPAFHAAASRTTCFNYDPWAMRPAFIRAAASARSAGGRLLLIEAMMGLHDGAADGSGTPADLAVLLGLPVVMVVDCSRMSHSVAALVRGYVDFRDDVSVAGVILNKVGSIRHEAMLRDALSRVKVPVFGALPRDPALALPERHLGLVQAGEHGGLESFISNAARLIGETCDLDALLAAAAPGCQTSSAGNASPFPPPGQRIAIARDKAFAFLYPHLVEGWRAAGAELAFFSPLADEGPDDAADAVYLPGGYPELHAGALANASRFAEGMRAAAARGARVYGECGGYMVLGDGLIDGEGTRHAMLGLLPLVTSFAERRRQLGYRRLTPRDGSGFDGTIMAHEFHYSTAVFEGDADRLFDAVDAGGVTLGAVGLRRGNVCGSYMHLIDRADA